MPTAILPKELDERLVAVDQWLVDYLQQPHPELGRSGPVCPYVEPATRAGSLEKRLRLLGSTPSVGLIAETIRCALDEFVELPWLTNPTLRAVIILIPDIPDDRLEFLDQAHRLVKPEAVERGLMIGQLHPRCAEPAARNPDFPVNRAPVPMIAIRAMARHDVLFLHHKREWFTEHLKRFGHRMPIAGHSLDPLADRLFEAARSAYCRTDPPPPDCGKMPRTSTGDIGRLPLTKLFREQGR